MMTKCVNAIMKALEIACMALLATAVVFVAMQIVFRYFLSSPLGWTEQSARFCFIWIVMMGIPIMFHRKCEISFDFLREKLPNGQHRMLMLFFEVLGIFFCVLYFIYGVSLCLRTGNRLTSGLAIPLNCLYAAQPLSAVLTILVFLNRIVETVREKKGEMR